MAEIKGAMLAVVGLVLSAYLVATLIPNAIEVLVATDTANWTGGTGDLWGVLPVFVIIAVMLIFVGFALRELDVI
jgi:hypothetical protein